MNQSFSEKAAASIRVMTMPGRYGWLWQPQDADADEVRERIEAVTGNKPKETLEEDDADFGKTLEWNWEGIGISLYESEGGISISLSLAQE